METVNLEVLKEAFERYVGFINHCQQLDHSAENKVVFPPEGMAQLLKLKVEKEAWDELALFTTGMFFGLYIKDVDVEIYMNISLQETIDIIASFYATTDSAS